MIKRSERMVKREGGEKKNVGVKYFSAIMIFAPTRLRTGAFISRRDKHRQRALSNDRKRFNQSRTSIGSSDVSVRFLDRFRRKASYKPSSKTARFCCAGSNISNLPIRKIFYVKWRLCFTCFDLHFKPDSPALICYQELW